MQACPRFGDVFAQHAGPVALLEIHARCCRFGAWGHKLPCWMLLTPLLVLMMTRGRGVGSMLLFANPFGPAAPLPFGPEATRASSCGRAGRAKSFVLPDHCPPRKHGVGGGKPWHVFQQLRVASPLAKKLVVEAAQVVEFGEFRIGQGGVR